MEGYYDPMAAASSVVDFANELVAGDSPTLFTDHLAEDYDARMVDAKRTLTAGGTLCCQSVCCCRDLEYHRGVIETGCQCNTVARDSVCTTHALLVS